MLSTELPRVEAAALPSPPPLAPGDSLFLDFDGTLIELADRPDAVRVESDLIDLLARLSERLDGRVAIVSGRSIAQLDALLGTMATNIAIAGSHGAELRTVDQGHSRPAPEQRLAGIARRIEAFAAARPGMIAEIKSYGAALHYRLAPDHGAEALAFAAALAAEHGLVLQRGKMMAEVRIAGDKGAAMHALMRLPAFAGAIPLFFGDDVTDEDGFAAARSLGGAGVLIGTPRPTEASYRLDDVAALRRWLAQGVEALA